MPRALQRVWIPAVVLAVVSLYYWKITLTDQYSWLDSPDFAYQVLPWFQFQAGEWHAGRFPLWDPYEWGGQSLIGQAQPGAAYPLNWLLFLLPLRNGWMRQICLHWYFVAIHFMAVMFGYWMCRDLIRSRGASLVGGLAFGLGGWMGTTEWPQMLNGALWAPLVTMFLLRVVRGRQVVRNAGLGGWALGMAFLSGHHQAPTFIALAAGGIWLAALALAEGRARPRLAVALAVFGTMLLLVSALQALPAYEYGRAAVRWVGAANDPVGWKDPVPYKVHSRFGLGPMSVVGTVVPTIMQNASPFIGMAVIALAFLGVAARWAAREVRILAGMAVGGLLFSLSQFNIFHGMLYALAPLVEKARNPSMAILVFHFAAAALAAYGLDAALERDGAAEVWSRRIGAVAAGFAGLFGIALVGMVLAGNAKVTDHERVLLAPVMAGLVGALLYGARRGNLSRRWLVAGFGIVALVEFGYGGSIYGWRHKGDPGTLLVQLSRDSDVAGFLQKQPGPPRVELDLEAVPYNFGEWYGIDAFDGYTASVQTNIYGIQADYPARMLLGLNFYLGKRALRKNQLEVFRGRNGLNIYANPDAGPRAWVVHETERIAPHELSFQWQKPVAELRTKAFLTAPAPALARCDRDERVRLLTRDTNRVVVEAELACRGLVVVAEPYCTGWEAHVDGLPAPIHEVYGMLRGVVVDGGRHRIEMVYRPKSVYWGAWGTGIGLLAAVGLGLRRPRRML